MTIDTGPSHPMTSDMFPDLQSESDRIFQMEESPSLAPSTETPEMVETSIEVVSTRTHAVESGHERVKVSFLGV